MGIPVAYSARVINQYSWSDRLCSLLWVSILKCEPLLLRLQQRLTQRQFVLLPYTLTQRFNWGNLLPTGINKATVSEHTFSIITLPKGDHFLLRSRLWLSVCCWPAQPLPNCIFKGGSQVYIYVFHLQFAPTFWGPVCIQLCQQLAICFCLLPFFFCLFLLAIQLLSMCTYSLFCNIIYIRCIELCSGTDRHTRGGLITCILEGVGH